MSRTRLRFGLAVGCGLVCVGCPLVIAWLGCDYGFDRLPSDNDFRQWRVDLVGWLFVLALLGTGGLLSSLGRWWWLGALLAVPLLVLTGVLAVTCGMWLDGSYF